MINDIIKYLAYTNAPKFITDYVRDNEYTVQLYINAMLQNDKTAGIPMRSIQEIYIHSLLALLADIPIKQYRETILFALEHQINFDKYDEKYIITTIYFGNRNNATYKETILKILEANNTTANDLDCLLSFFAINNSDSLILSKIIKTRNKNKLDNFYRIFSVIITLNIDEYIKYLDNLDNDLIDIHIDLFKRYIDKNLTLFIPLNIIHNEHLKGIIYNSFDLFKIIDDILMSKYSPTLLSRFTYYISDKKKSKIKNYLFTKRRKYIISVPNLVKLIFDILDINRYIPITDIIDKILNNEYIDPSFIDNMLKYFTDKNLSAKELALYILNKASPGNIDIIKTLKNYNIYIKIPRNDLLEAIDNGKIRNKYKDFLLENFTIDESEEIVLESEKAQEILDYKDCAEPDQITLEDWSDENTPEIKIYIVNPVKTRVLCFKKENLIEWFRRSDIIGYAWYGAYDDVGYGGKPEIREPYVKFIDGSYFVNKKDDIIKMISNEYKIYALPIYKRKRLGISFAVSGIHGQAPGYPIYYLIPSKDYNNRVQIIKEYAQNMQINKGLNIRDLGNNMEEILEFLDIIKDIPFSN